MTDIGKLKEIKPGEAEGLRRANLKTIEALWSRVAKGPKEISLIAAESGIREERLLNLLVNEGQRDSRNLGSPWLKRHWLDLILAAGIIALLLLIVRAAL